VRLTVLGCSGSVTGPDSPASGYLVTAPDAPPLAVDFGGGVLGALQRHANPNDVTVLLSHLHADHCLDIPGLLVWRRYGPDPAVERALLYGPPDSALRLGVASAEIGGECDDLSDTLEVRSWVEREPVRFGELSVTPFEVFHPPQSYGFRIEDSSGTVLAYSGDTGLCDAVEELARGADLFLCEASWTHDPGNRPVGVHLSGTEAGEVARRAGAAELLITHVPPWTSREDVLAEARAAFNGPVRLANASESFEVVKCGSPVRRPGR
jgi:ribonuclease BN (tRNA processing enzyme)